ncbi:unnamed protein product, partial [marine sediment metagenome]
MANNELKTKTCPHCKETKPLSGFYKKRRGYKEKKGYKGGYRDGVSYICINCAKKVSSAYSKTPQGKRAQKISGAKYHREHQEYFLNNARKRKYGITPEQYN